MISTSTYRSIGLAFLVVLFLSIAATLGANAQTATSNPVELGARLFARNCAVCHGPDGKGRVGAVLAKNWPSIRPDLEVKTTIENGVPGSPMPAWSQKNGGPLTDEEISALTLFILSWQTGGIPAIPTEAGVTQRPPISPIPNVTGDPNHGAVLYDENCAVCHGPNGEGRIGAVLAKNWPTLRPDLRIKATIETGISGSPMPAWSQKNGGPLADQDINDLVSFVLSLPAISVSAGQPTSPPENLPTSPLSGIGGVVLLIVLFIVIVALILLIQARRPKDT